MIFINSIADAFINTLNFNFVAIWYIIDANKWIDSDMEKFWNVLN